MGGLNEQAQAQGRQQGDVPFPRPLPGQGQQHPQRDEHRRVQNGVEPGLYREAVPRLPEGPEKVEAHIPLPPPQIQSGEAEIPKHGYIHQPRQVAQQPPEEKAAQERHIFFTNVFFQNGPKNDGQQKPAPYWKQDFHGG